ncbi:hypothetical protein EDC55_11226 [Allofrancisella inopinata]|nr:hypothetical protein [Allofrancisella inopinata]TDT71339.1 hypothetical protein EDC55_11226 [Allofrancisella inopinata]
MLIKKPNFDIINQSDDYNYRAEEGFSINKLNEYPKDIVELFKLIQAVRYDRIQLQEQYNDYREKLNNDRMELGTELIKIKKAYNAKIVTLQEEYNSVKSNTMIELAKLRQG